MQEYKIESYSLYQTLDKNIPITDLTIKEKNQLKSDVSTFQEPQKIAFIRLIIEYSRINDNNVNIKKIPYSTEIATDNFEFDVDNFPIKLRWILLKFCNVCSQENENKNKV